MDHRIRQHLVSIHFDFQCTALKMAVHSLLLKQHRNFVAQNLTLAQILDQIIAKNKNEFIEPDTTWINTISLNNY